MLEIGTLSDIAHRHRHIRYMFGVTISVFDQLTERYALRPTPVTYHIKTYTHA